MTRSKAFASAVGMILLAMAVAPGAAVAGDTSVGSVAVWKAMGNCATAATRAHPDYTAESLAKREAARRRCLQQNNLPGGDTPQRRTR